MEEKRHYETIVAGGGIAGLTCAAYLARGGREVLLLEKNNKTGGLVNSFTIDGFTFDGGIRAFENSGIVFPMLKQLGIDMDFFKNPVRIGIEDTMTGLKDRNSLRHYKYMLEKNFPESKSDIAKIIKEIEKVIGYMDVLYGIDNPLFVDYMKDPGYIFGTLLPWLLRYQLKIGKVERLKEPINDYLLRFTDNRALIDMITQHFFKNTPAFFALSYFGLYLDYCYPAGGTGVLAEKLETYARERGSRIETEKEVVKVDATTNTVTTRDGMTLSYDNLVWCADMKRLYQILIDEPDQETDIQRQLVEAGDGGDSILTVFLTVDQDKEYFDETCGAHCFYTPFKRGLGSMTTKDWRLFEDKDKKEGIRQWSLEYLELTTYEISCPVVRDYSLAPAGQTGLIVSTLLDYDLVAAVRQDGWYDEFKKLCEEKIIGVLEKSIFKGIEKRVLKSLSSTPLSLERITGNYKGAITGWAFKGEEMPSEDRFRKIKRSVLTPVPGISQAGQWCFSPSGLPVAILTGKLAADEITGMKKEKRVAEREMEDDQGDS